MTDPTTARIVVAASGRACLVFLTRRRRSVGEACLPRVADLAVRPPGFAQRPQHASADTLHDQLHVGIRLFLPRRGADVQECRVDKAARARQDEAYEFRGIRDRCLNLLCALLDQCSLVVHGNPVCDLRRLHLSVALCLPAGTLAVSFDLRLLEEPHQRSARCVRGSMSVSAPVCMSTPVRPTSSGKGLVSAPMRKSPACTGASWARPNACAASAFLPCG